jgi:hypothetical protein
MKKRISCTTINSKLLCDDFVCLEALSRFNSQGSHFILNSDDSVPGASIYTRKLNVIKVQADDFLTEESLDFYA